MKRFFLLLCCASLCICWSTGSIATANAGQANSAAKEKHDVIFWESVKDSNNIDMFRAYLKNYPNGIFADLAKIKINILNKEVIFWESVKDSNNIDMLRAYLKNYPKGKFADSAKTQIESLENVSQKPASIQSIKAPLLLRNTPMRLEEDEIKKMVKKHNFCDWYRNPKADFKNDFVDNNDDTITDRATGLVWQKIGSWRKMSLKKADRYVKDLNGKKFAGRSNWRLPTVEELASLIENSSSGDYLLYINPIFGDQKDGNWLDKCWTADTLRPIYGSDDAAWVVDFYNCGIVTAHWYYSTVGSAMIPENESNYVRAVSSIKQK